MRMRPSFVLAGAQRCGTTSLFRALQQHPAVFTPVYHKGVNYFDQNYGRGPDWYRAHFPLRSVAAMRTRGSGEEAVAFEASGYYMYHPHAPRRLGEDLPDVRAVVMLRDPVERAYSAYRHEFARGFETETFETALELEDERVQPEFERMLVDPAYQSFSHRHHSYRRRGEYAKQIQALMTHLQPDRLLVVDSHDFFAHPEQEFDRITAFLGLRPYVPARFDQWNARPGSQMSSQAQRFLTTALEPHDEALRELLGRRPSWRR
jgi:Sulfotransferase domain